MFTIKDITYQIAVWSMMLAVCFQLCSCPRRLWLVNEASEDIRACVEMRECIPTSKYNIMMDSVRLFPYAHIDLHPVDITFESSRMGICRYRLECANHNLLLKRKDTVIDSMDISSNTTDITLILGDDCSIVFAMNKRSNSPAAARLLAR